MENSSIDKYNNIMESVLFSVINKIYWYNKNGEVMIICTGNDKDFINYKDKINNRKVLFHIKRVTLSV